MLKLANPDRNVLFGIGPIVALRMIIHLYKKRIYVVPLCCLKP